MMNWLKGVNMGVEGLASEGVAIGEGLLLLLHVVKLVLQIVIRVILVVLIYGFLPSLGLLYLTIGLLVPVHFRLCPY